MPEKYDATLGMTFFDFLFFILFLSFPNPLSHPPLTFPAASLCDILVWRSDQTEGKLPSWDVVIDGASYLPARRGMPEGVWRGICNTNPSLAGSFSHVPIAPGQE